MNLYRVEIQENGNPRWMSVGLFNARTAAGAISQFAKTIGAIPDCTAVRTEYLGLAFKDKRSTS